MTIEDQLREKAICGRLLDNEPVPMKGCDFKCDSCEVKDQVSHYVYLGHALAVLATHQQELQDLWKAKPNLMTVDYEGDENESDADVLERWGNDLTTWLERVEKLLGGGVEAT